MGDTLLPCPASSLCEDYLQETGFYRVGGTAQTEHFQNRRWSFSFMFGKVNNNNNKTNAYPAFVEFQPLF